MDRTPRMFLRDIDAGNTLETFFIAAILSLLTVRFALHLTGYPQLGGAHLHIAHVLWGGLLLAIAVLIQLSFLTRSSGRLAAVFGGVGFGLFIDEVGKFLTKDTNYFFQPAVAVIYVVFVLVLIGVRTIRTVRPFSPREYLLNALRATQEVVLHDLDPEERRRALGYLDASDPSDPLVPPLRTVLQQAGTITPPAPRALMKLRHWTRGFYEHLAGRSGFHSVVVAFFVIKQGISLIFITTAVLVHRATVEEILNARILRIFAQRLQVLSIAGTLELGATVLATVLAIWGMALIPRSRLAAFRMFERSVLVSIFLAQVFAFYREQFWALLGLAVNVLVLLTLRYMIGREKAAGRGGNGGRRGLAGAQSAPASTASR